MKYIYYCISLMSLSSADPAEWNRLIAAVQTRESPAAHSIQGRLQRSFDCAAATQANVFER